MGWDLVERISCLVVEAGYSETFRVSDFIPTDACV